MANPFDNPQMNESWMYAQIQSGIVPSKGDMAKVALGWVVKELNEPKDMSGTLKMSNPFDTPELNESNIGVRPPASRIDTRPLVVGKTMKTYTLSDGRIFKDYQDVMFDRKGDMKYGQIMNKNGNYFIVRDSQNPKKIYKVSEGDIEADAEGYLDSVFAQPEEWISSDEEEEEEEFDVGRVGSFKIVNKIVGGKNKKTLVDAETRRVIHDVDWRSIQIKRLNEQLNALKVDDGESD